MARALRGVAIVVAIATLGVLAQAGEAPPIALQWMAPPEECPDAAYVYGEIARLLGGEARATDSKVTAKAKIVHVKDGLWRVTLTTKTTPSEGGAPSEGSRTVEAESCRSLTDATALILALTINPERVAATAASSSSSSGSPLGSSSALGSSLVAAPSAPSASTSVVASAPSATIVATPADSVSPPISSASASPSTTANGGPDALASFVFGGALDTGTLPFVALGLGATNEARVDRLRLQAIGFWSPKRRATLANRPTAGGDFDLYSLGARVGVSLLDPALSFELAPTLSLAWSRIRASGFGVDRPNDASIDSVALGPGGYAALRLTKPVFLRLQVEALFPLRRPDFVLDAIGDVHTVPLLVGRAQLGLEARF